MGKQRLSEGKYLSQVTQCANGGMKAPGNKKKYKEEIQRNTKEGKAFVGEEFILFSQIIHIVIGQYLLFLLKRN